MNHLALYRKYRPQSFDSVVGQDALVSLLKKSIEQDKIAHAYLFCGGRGTGKTSVARIFAKSVGSNDEDIIEIDAASNRLIDNIRDLREAVRTQPFSSRYKVYIIDEAHMLTKEAANAFLKTLEEPPAHVIFILATTDPDKLPETIVSRCQKIVFNQPTVEVLRNQLIYVAKQEGYTLDESSATLIARRGNGSYRDALGVLEQVLRISEKKIDPELVENFLGTSHKAKLFEVITALCKKDTSSLVTILADIEHRGIDAQALYDDILEIIRQGLLIKATGIHTTSKEQVFIEGLTKEYPLFFTSKHIELLLAKRYLIDISHVHGWTAVIAIYVGTIE